MSSEGVSNYIIISLDDVLILRHWYWKLVEWLRGHGEWFEGANDR